MTSSPEYLLAGGKAELDRLTVQARVWEPDTNRMLDEIGLQAGANCVDLGCGAIGVLASLRGKVGAQGHVVGVDLDPKLLGAAKNFLEERGIYDVELIVGDAYHTNLPDNTFDLTHVRFLFSPVGHDDQLLSEMIRLTKPGGIIVIQESDSSSWNCLPVPASWPALKNALLQAFKLGGGDFDAGHRMFGMLRKAGLEDVHIHASLIALQDQHPYMRSALQFTSSLRERILKNNILSEDELNRAYADYEQAIAKPETTVTSFTINQVWGRKPE
ncbi:MAG: methyltransferase domain-containing protein [Anaerolineaceae bacterium]|nr:methyltransferase domain-containing protein [Anaerolineaceae bacterium]